MLPDRLIEVRRIEEGNFAPAWLSSRDQVWLRVLCDEMESFSGRAVAGVELRAKNVAEHLARQHRIPAGRVEAAWLVARRQWSKFVDSPVAPKRIRSLVFELAAQSSPEEGLARAAKEFGVSELVIQRLLFSDRDAERIFLPPKIAVTPHSLLESCNLAVTQALIARAFRLRIVATSDLRHVLSFAKFLGLMMRFYEGTDSFEIELSGPLSLFHETRKYGLALSRFLPALASTVGWSADADVLLRGQHLTLKLSSADPLPRTHSLPRSFDSKVERRLAIDLKKLGPERGWRLERESVVVSLGVGAQLFYPDFTLVSERGGRVLVEVVGFWTPDYLAKKQRALDAVTEPIVVCVDERHATEVGVPRSGRHAVVITYRDRIDASALLDAAEGALGRC